MSLKLLFLSLIGAFSLVTAFAGNHQCANTVVMISPDHFKHNAQTAETNYFQQGDFYDLTNNSAMLEFQHMVNNLSSHGVNVLQLKSRPDVETPDAVFPNNWFSLHNHHGKRVLVLYPMLTRNRRAERQAETLQQKLRERGMDVETVIDLSNFENKGKILEGTGSMVLDRKNKLCFCSLSPRADRDVVSHFANLLDYKAICFHSYDSQNRLLYHTNIMMSVGEGFALICLDSIKDPAEKKLVIDALSSTGKEIIQISMNQMENMCGNIIQVKNTDQNNVIVMSDRAHKNFTTSQRRSLKQHGKLVPCQIDTIENVGGGSARCMIAEAF